MRDGRVHTNAGDVSFLGACCWGDDLANACVGVDLQFITVSMWCVGVPVGEHLYLIAPCPVVGAVDEQDGRLGGLLNMASRTIGKHNQEM